MIVERARERQQNGDISLSPTTESVTANGLTPEKIQPLTWENLFELDDDGLRVVVRAPDLSSFSWGISMRNMPELFVQRVRKCVGKQDNFDSGVSYESKDTAEDERKNRENATRYVKRELLRILQQDNPS